MNMIEVIKEKTLWLIGAMLITIPLMACYPILRLLGFSARISTIATVLLSGIAYILLVTRIEPFLRRILPFTRPKAQNGFLSAKLKRGGTGLQIVKGPSSYPGVTESDVVSSNMHVVREPIGNWVHP